MHCDDISVACCKTAHTLMWALISNVTVLLVSIQYFCIHHVGYRWYDTREHTCGLDELVKHEFLAPVTTLADWQGGGRVAVCQNTASAASYASAPSHSQSNPIQSNEF